MKHNQKKTQSARAIYGETIRGNPMFGMRSITPIIGYVSAKKVHENCMPNWTKLNSKPLK